MSRFPLFLLPPLYFIQSILICREKKENEKNCKAFLCQAYLSQ